MTTVEKNEYFIGVLPNGKALGLGANHRCAADPGEGCVFALILVYSPVFGRVERGKGKLTTVLTTIEYFIGVWPNGKALGLGPRSRRFDSCHSDQLFML